MADDAPAWALESMVLRLDTAAPAAASSPEWAFGGSTGAGVRVAIVDSGVDADHPDLDHCVDRDGGVDVTMDDDGEVSIRSGPHDDVFGHGTACAGIIHALAPEARLTSVRVLGPGLTGRAAAFHAGLAWAVDEGFDVINLSLGTTKRDWALAFHEVCDRAYFGGSFIVTAANNVARTSYPSLFASVASVACNTATDALRFHANPSPPTEFLARGIDVEVPWLDGGTTTSTGNSYAAPHIAAFAALAKAKHPELRPFELKAVLWAASANVAAAAGAGEDPEAPTAAGRRAAATAGPGTATLVTRHLGPLVAEARAALDLGGGDAPPPPPPVAAAPRRPAPPALLLPGYAAEDDGVDGPWGRRVPARREVDGWRCTVHDLRPVIGPDTALAAEVAAAVEVASRVCHPHLEEVTVLMPSGPLVVTPRPRADVRALGREDALSFSDALAVALAVTAALDGLHRRGLVHGDVRADGVVVDASGAARLGWCGIAGVRGSPVGLTSATREPDVLRAVAPEQLRGRAPDARSDVHGVGLVLYELLTGAQAHPEVTTVAGLQRRAAAAPPVPAATLAPALPATVTAVVDRALAVDPADRHPDAAALGADLGAAARALVGAGAIAASPYVGLDHVAQWVGRPA